MQKTPANYWAVLPFNVRRDKTLTDFEKLLYCEITALTEQEGYCWATNEYLAEIYDKGIRTISRHISNLQEKGYVKVVLEKSPKGWDRKIFTSCVGFEVLPKKKPRKPKLFKKQD